MCCKSWKSILPFAVTFLVGVFVVNTFVNKIQKEAKIIYVDGHSYGYSDESSNKGNGNAACYGISGKRNNIFNFKDDENSSEVNQSKSEITPLKILAKPKALFTYEARQNQTQGVVRLRVVFNANGSIGSISPVSSLPNGLTEQAMLAAREIKFEPQKIKNIPQTVIKQVDYSFTLY